MRLGVAADEERAAAAAADDEAAKNNRSSAEECGDYVPYLDGPGEAEEAAAALAKEMGRHLWSARAQARSSCF